MYSVHCARCLGFATVPLGVLSALASLLLLFPDLQYRYLKEGHVTPNAQYCTGIWLSGFVVLVAARGFASRYTKEGCCLFRADMLCRTAYSSVALCAAVFCFLINADGLTTGPLCLHNGTEGLTWSQPLERPNLEAESYLYEPERWPSACLEPRGVVMWNIVLFSTVMVASGLQAVICIVQILHTILGVVFGPRFCKDKVVLA